MSDINAPVTSLLGVFLGPDQPDEHPAPITLDFVTPLSRDYATLSPLLQQVFFMGDGLTSAALAQSVIVPAGATRLYLGVMDGYGWANNGGSFDVRFGCTGVPDAGATLTLLSMALIVLACVLRPRAGVLAIARESAPTGR